MRDPFSDDTDPSERRYANEEWRRDPDRRQAAYDAHAEWLAALDEAEPHLRAALAAFDGLRDEEHFRLQAKVRDALRTAVYELDRIKTFREPASDTKVGNMAAFGVGWRD